MKWIIPYVWLYSLFLTLSIAFHLKCIIWTGANACEIKERHLRRGKRRFVALPPGKNVLLPFIHTRVIDSETRNPVLIPIDFGVCNVSTGPMMVTTQDKKTIVVDARFTYRFPDATAFLDADFSDGVVPAIAAMERTHKVIKGAIGSVRMRDDNALAVFKRIIHGASEEGKVVHVQLVNVIVFAEVVDLLKGSGAGA